VKLLIKLCNIFKKVLWVHCFGTSKIKKVPPSTAWSIIPNFQEH
jgi:hypothetical protein